jgi:hypothetical protein
MNCTYPTLPNDPEGVFRCRLNGAGWVWVLVGIPLTLLAATVTTLAPCFTSIRSYYNVRVPSSATVRQVYNSICYQDSFSVLSFFFADHDITRLESPILI